MPNSNFLVKKWKKHLSEKVNPESINVSGLEVKDSLNSDVWEDEDFVNSDIKRNLERIARDFIESLGIEVNIDDIVITGSIANYNWSRFSDIDVHILVDFDEIDENHDLVREMFQKAHAQWNRTHEIKVKDHEVEIYVQDIDEPHHSSGIYSILGDKWVKKPIKDTFTLNKNEIRAKSAHLMDDIDEIEELLDNNDFKQAFDDATRLREKIRNFRKGGLEKGGEYSSENLSFKILRRNGYLERLSDMKNEAYDKMMSLEEETVLTETMADLKRVKEKYKDDIAMSAAIGRLESGDPSGNHKYMNWFVKQLERESDIEGEARFILSMVDSIQMFHKYNHLVDKKDIAQYKSFDDLRATANIAKEQYRKREYEKKHHQELSTQASEESDVIYDDEEFMVIRPNTEHASCWYGKSTKWCIAATEAQNYFDQYTSEGKAFYIILDKTRHNTDPLKKVAWVGDSSGEFVEHFNAINASIGHDAAVHQMEETTTTEKINRIEGQMGDHLANNLPDSGWQEQVDEIKEKYEERMEWIMLGEVEVEDHGDNQWIHMNAHARMKFDNPEPVKRVQQGRMPSNLGHHPSHEQQTKKEIKDAMMDNYSENAPEYLDFDIKEMIGSHGDDMFVVEMGYTGGDMGVSNSPEGYEDFCLMMERIDDNFPETQLKVRKILVADDYIQPNAFDKHAEGYVEADFDSSDTDENYDLVAVSYDPNEHEIKILIPVNIPRDVWDIFEKRVKADPHVSMYSVREITSLNAASHKVLNKTLKQMQSRQGELPGLESPPVSSSKAMKVLGYIPSSLEIELNGDDADKEVEDAYRIARLIDNNFEGFKKIYTENLKNYGEEDNPEHPEEYDPDEFEKGEAVTEAADYITTGYQKIARKQFGKGMRLTVRGGNRYKVGKMKVINPKVGKSAPPGME